MKAYLAPSSVDVARDKRQESLRGAEEARERSLVVLYGGAGAQSPSVDGLQADAPEPFGSTAGSCRPQVHVMVRLGFRVLGVLLAQQARRWLQRAHQGIRLDQIAEVHVLGDQHPGQRRPVQGHGDGQRGLPGIVHRPDQLPENRVDIVLRHAITPQMSASVSASASPTRGRPYDTWTA